MRFSLDDLGRWDGRFPVVLVGPVATEAARRSAFRDFARRICGDPTAETRHDGLHAPRLVGHAAIHLSSASRDGFAAFAAASGPVGVDVERVDLRAELPLGVLHPDERAGLAQRPVAERPRAFAALWAAKEAYLKAIGLGLTRDPASFHVDVGPDRCTIADGGRRIETRIEEHRSDEAVFVVALVSPPHAEA